MRRMNVYDLYMDDGHSTFKVTVPAFSKKDAKEYVQGNGDVVAVKPSELQDIDLNCLADTLKRSGWGQQEIDIIVRALAQIGLER
jgi:hypothetical protein